MARVWCCLLLLACARLGSCLEERREYEETSLMRGSSGGQASLEQAADGSWVQALVLHGVALPGWQGLRHAFTRQIVTCACPSSEEFMLTVTVYGEEEEEEEEEEAAGHVRRRSSGTRQRSRRRLSHLSKHCRGHEGAGSAGGAPPPPPSAAPGSSCNATVPAVGDSTLIIVQPGQLGEPAAPEPCTLPVSPAFAPALAASAGAGTALLLLGPWAVRSPLGERLIRLYCLLGPVLSAFSCIFKLAVSGLFIAAVLTVVSLGIEGPHAAESREALQKVILIVAGVFGFLMCIGTLAAGLAVRRQRYRAWHSTRLRHTTPWVLQLAGAGLISTNSQQLNWTLRVACFAAWLLFVRPRQPQLQAAWGQEEEAASSAQAAPAAAAPGAAAADSGSREQQLRQRQRVQREQLQQKLLGGAQLASGLKAE